jgi:hypothetical protein
MKSDKAELKNSFQMRLFTIANKFYQKKKWYELLELMQFIKHNLSRFYIGLYWKV